MRRRSDNFHFQGGRAGPMPGRGEFSWGRFIPLCILWSHIFAWPIVFILLCNFGRYMEKSSNIREKVNFK